MNEDYLEHHGILGQRWGIRRFQPYSSTGKRKSGKAGKEVGEAAKKSKTLKSTEAEKPKVPEKAPEEKQREFEEGKARALKSGSARDILQYQGHLTNKEMTEAINRIRNENSLKELAAKDAPKVKTGEDRINDLMRKVEVAKKVANTLAETKSTYDKVKKAFTDEDPAVKQKKKDISSLSAQALIDKYGIGKLTTDELDSAIKRLKKEHELENMAKGIFSKDDKEKGKS